MNPVCQYCSEVSKLVDGSVIYPHRSDLFSKSFYYCDNNHSPAYVGCHPRSNKPLGTLADKELRGMRNAAHRAFDPLWRNGLMSRSNAYRQLSDYLMIKQSDCHIAMFDQEMCRRVIEFTNNKNKALHQ